MYDIAFTLVKLFVYSAIILVASDNCNLVEADRHVLELTSDNFDDSTNRYQIVVLNFYADWCPYSARWKPIFQDTAKVVYNETAAQDTNLIVFGQINCEIQTTLAQRFRVTKYPTTKLTLNGKQLKKEYRGARTALAFKEYVGKYLSDPIHYITDKSELTKKIDERKGAIIIYSGRPDEVGDKPVVTNELLSIRKITQQLREDCDFFYVLNSASGDKVKPPETYSIFFKPHHKSLDHEIPYPQSISDPAGLYSWIKDQCVPLIREITFENAEELTEEGLPFVILFYDPNDKSWIEIYKRIVEKELVSEANKVTFLFADGYVFSHPLKHLGKTVKDLPLVAIDSFKHLFLYKKPVASISQPGNLKQFVLDLHSGKLDREFHFGPDPTNNIVETSATTPPESAFNKLGPSAHRYSFMRDEL